MYKGCRQHEALAPEWHWLVIHGPCDHEAAQEGRIIEGRYQFLLLTDPRSLPTHSHELGVFSFTPAVSMLSWRPFAVQCGPHTWRTASSVRMSKKPNGWPVACTAAATFRLKPHCGASGVPAETASKSSMNNDDIINGIFFSGEHQGLAVFIQDCMHGGGQGRMGTVKMQRQTNRAMDNDKLAKFRARRAGEVRSCLLTLACKEETRVRELAKEYEYGQDARSGIGRNTAVRWNTGGVRGTH